MIKDKLKIFIVGGGDYEVGIPSTEASITLEEQGAEFSDDDIKHLKDFAHEFFDNNTQEYTEQEIKEQEEEERKHNKECLINEILSLKDNEEKLKEFLNDVL
jgi:hypothetical protein